MPPTDPKAWIVLVIDDDPDNLEVAQAVLKFNGAEVHTAINGVVAMEVLQKVTPTFVLSDISMPEMSGWEFLKAVRGDDKLKNIPVIALTAHAMADDREKVKEAGFDGYITKPFWMHTLLNDIKKSLEALETKDAKDSQSDKKSKDTD